MRHEAGSEIVVALGFLASKDGLLQLAVGRRLSERRRTWAEDYAVGTYGRRRQYLGHPELRRCGRASDHG